MAYLVGLKVYDLLDSAVPGRGTGTVEVGGLEFGHCLLVVFRLELLEDGSES